MLQTLSKTLFGSTTVRRRPMTANKAMEGRPFNLLRSFALLSLASILVIGVVSGIVMQRYVTNHMLQREATVTTEFIQSVIDASTTTLAAGDLGQYANQNGRLVELLGHISHIPDVVRANVYSPDEVLVWSTEKNLIGKKFEFNDELRETLRGEMTFELVRLSETNKGEHAFFAEGVTDFVETYVPIWDLGRSQIIGVAEVYRVPDALFHAIAQGRLLIFVGGFLGGTFLYVVLFWIVRRANTLILRQEQRLENEIDEHKRDKRTLTRSERALRVLSAKLLGAQEQERKRIAGELHDGLGQSLSAAKFNLEGSLVALTPCGTGRSIEIMQGAIGKVRDAIDEVRRISMDLRPAILDDLGILATIDWFCREFQQVHPNVTIDKRVTVAEGEVPEILKIVIYRIVQEAFNNVAKHARADRANVELARIGARLELRITDNGRGFDYEGCRSGGNGYKGIGLQSMGERAELSGGELRIDSRPGQGTRLEVVWPGAGEMRP